jgi:hypothetical protein
LTSSHAVAVSFNSCQTALSLSDFIITRICNIRARNSGNAGQLRSVAELVPKCHACGDLLFVQ